MKNNLAIIPAGEPPHGQRVQAALDAIESAKNLLDYACRCMCSVRTKRPHYVRLVKLSQSVEKQWWSLHESPDRYAEEKMIAGGEGRP
jgi:hypothetical protein